MGFMSGCDCSGSILPAGTAMSMPSGLNCSRRKYVCSVSSWNRRTRTECKRCSGGKGSVALLLREVTFFVDMSNVRNTLKNLL